MRTRSPVLRIASPPPAAASGEALRIEGGGRGAGLPSAVADTGQRVDAALDERRRWLHVHDFRAARVTDRPRAAE